MNFTSHLFVVSKRAGRLASHGKKSLTFKTVAFKGSESGGNIKRIKAIKFDPMFINESGALKICAPQSDSSREPGHCSERDKNRPQRV